MEKQPGLILAGKIRGCFGIRGQLKMELAGRAPEKAGDLKRVFVGRVAEDARPYTVTEVRVNGPKVVIRLESVEDRTAAERLTGLNLFVAEEDAVRPPKGSWYIHELIGCEVVTETGEPVGTVSDVVDAGGRHLWVVTTRDGERYVPALKEFIAGVDIVKRTVIVRSLEGLLEL